MIAGQLNKQVAFDLGTSERTIKAHRHSVMQKLEAGSVADLVRLASNLGIAPLTQTAAPTSTKIAPWYETG